MRKRQTQSYISQIADAKGNIYTEPSSIVVTFVSHFQKILAPAVDDQCPDLSHVTPHSYFTKEDAFNLMKPATNCEIMEVIKAANPNKSLGLMDSMHISLRCVGLL